MRRRSSPARRASTAFLRSTAPSTPWSARISDTAERFHSELLARRFPWIGAEPLRTVPCLYTTTRGSRFVIDRHPAHPNVHIVSACSGHGFKHSAAIGEAVAQTIVDGASKIDLSPFSVAAAGERPTID